MPTDHPASICVHLPLRKSANIVQASCREDTRPFLKIARTNRKFFPMLRELPLILFGVGGVGRAFIRQIVADRTLHATEYGLRINMLALCDSSGAAMELGQGIDDVNLVDLLELKEAGAALSEHALGSAAQGSVVDSWAWQGASAPSWSIARPPTLPCLHFCSLASRGTKSSWPTRSRLPFNRRSITGSPEPVPPATNREPGIWPRHAGRRPWARVCPLSPPCTD